MHRVSLLTTLFGCNHSIRTDDFDDSNCCGDCGDGGVLEAIDVGWTLGMMLMLRQLVLFYSEHRLT